MSLARKYRLQKFRELIGQELISEALLQTLKRKTPPQPFSPDLTSQQKITPAQLRRAFGVSFDFLKSWEELCRWWKEHQPLQATELYFVRAQSYSPHQITLVFKDSKTSQRLLEPTKIQDLPLSPGEKEQAQRSQGQQLSVTQMEQSAMLNPYKNTSQKLASPLKKPPPHNHLRKKVALYGQTQ